MKRMLIFHPALAPYRVDQFNELAKLYDLEVVFLFDNLWNHKLDQNYLQRQLHCNYSYLLNGFYWRGRAIRKGVLSKIVEVDPDIIIASELSIVTWQVIILKRMRLTRATIGTMVDGSVQMCQAAGMLRRVMERVAFRQLDFIVVLSKQVQVYYNDKYGMDEERVIIAPIHQSEKRLKENRDTLCEYADEYACQQGLRGKKVLLFVGRLVPVKNLVPFLDMVADVFKKHRNMDFVIVGDGEERPYLDACILRHELQQQVKLVGRFEGDRLYAWYMCASGFVLPSVSEAFGAVIDEALCFGVRSFCSERAGIAGLVTSARGECFNPLSEVDVVSAFTRFAESLVPYCSQFHDRQNLLTADVYQELVDEWLKLNRMGENI